VVTLGTAALTATAKREEHSLRALDVWGNALERLEKRIEHLAEGR
jgi:hypothetical protein